MSNHQALQQVTAIAADMYKAEFSELTLRTWLMVLQPYDAGDLQRALVAHMRDPKRGQFCPKPADLIAQIDRARASGVDLAHLAIQRAIRTVSARHGVAFDDAAIHCAMESLGGWPRAYAETSNAETAGDYAVAFARAYSKAKEAQSPHPAFMPGISRDYAFACVGDVEGVDRVVESGYDPITKAIATTVAAVH